MEEGEEEGWAVIKGAGLKWVNREGIKRRVRVKGAIALWQTYCSVNGNTYVNKESPEMGWRGSSLRDTSFCQEPRQLSPPAPAPPQVTPFLQRLVPPLRAGHWQRGAPNPAYGPRYAKRGTPGKLALVYAKDSAFSVDGICARCFLWPVAQREVQWHGIYAQMRFPCPAASSTSSGHGSTQCVRVTTHLSNTSL